MTISICDSVLPLCRNILGVVKIRGLERVLMTSHFNLLTDRNPYLFVNSKIVLHKNSFELGMLAI